MSVDRSREAVGESRLHSAESPPTSSPRSELQDRPTGELGRGASLRLDPRAFARQSAAGFSRGWKDLEQGHGAQTPGEASTCLAAPQGKLQGAPLASDSTHCMTLGVTSQVPRLRRGK